MKFKARRSDRSTSSDKVARLTEDGHIDPARRERIEREDGSRGPEEGREHLVDVVDPLDLELLIQVHLERPVRLRVDERADDDGDLAESDVEPRRGGLRALVSFWSMGDERERICRGEHDRDWDGDGGDGAMAVNHLERRRVSELVVRLEEPAKGK